jgi:hypothetical protein
LLPEIRFRTKITAAELEQKKGKMLQPADVNFLLCGPCRVLKPDGKPLCVYLPASVPPNMRAESWEILHTLRGSYTDNRGMASGTPRIDSGATQQQRSRARLVDSAIAGAFDPSGPKQYCRLTAWTGQETARWQGLWPLFQHISGQLQQHVPERYAVQARQAARTAPEWLVPGTPFTTITINNTYETAVHTDKCDLEAGFSTLAVFRAGAYTGGWICFPEYRLAADMQDGDLLLMDAHEWHGNTPFSPQPAREHNGRLSTDPGYERISVVCYFRTNMVKCGSAADEAAKARMYADNRNAALVGE